MTSYTHNTFLQFPIRCNDSFSVCKKLTTKSDIIYCASEDLVMHIKRIKTKHLCPITGFVTRVKQRVAQGEQQLPTLPEHLSSPQLFSGIRVAQSFLFCVVFCRSFFVLLSIFVCTPLVSSNLSWMVDN